MSLCAYASIVAEERSTKSSESVTIVAGGNVQETLAAGESRKILIETSHGDFVRGHLDGLRLRLSLINRHGECERVLAEGKSEKQEFMFLAGSEGPYYLAVSSLSAGDFKLAIEMIVPTTEQKPPVETLESPRLRNLRESIVSGRSTAEFWREVEKGRGPLVEVDGVIPALPPDSALVTFLWRGAKQGVRLFGAPSGTHEDLKRLDNSDVWYGSYRVPMTSRISYKLAPDVPQLNASPMIRRRAILATAQRDPFNPLSTPPKVLSDKFSGESVLELPGAPKCPALERQADVKQGSVETHRVRSERLDNTRDIFLYRPHDYSSVRDGNSLLIVFDGDRYIDDIPLPTILDNLIAAKKIPPTAAVLISNLSQESRSNELPPNERFSEFLAEELMPWVKQQGLSADPSRTVVMGASFGGLAAAHAGFQHPELFGKVYSQSGSFWWAPGATSRTQKQVEPEWLTREFAATPLKPVSFYLEAGVFEVGGPGLTMLDVTRHLRDVLRAKGNHVHYAEFAGGHGYFYWRYTVADGIVALLGSGKK